LLVVLAVPELEADEGEVGGGVIGAEAAGALGGATGSTTF